MRDYNIDEVRDILKSINENDIKVANHVFDRWLDRKYDINYIINCLINTVPLGNIKTTSNRFKLIFPDKNKESKDLYVIISLSDFGEVTIITAYHVDKGRRKRE